MQKTLIKSLFLLSILLVVPNFANAEISFTNGKWSSTFNYGECSQFGGGGMPDCGTATPDGINYNWGGASVGGKYTQVTAAANNPAGGGGNGHRAWIGDGQNINSGQIAVRFPHKTELWVRWYERYQAGFNWNPLGYSKELYFTTDGPGISVIVEPHSSYYSLVAQGTPVGYPVSTSYGWNSIMGGSKSDGLFHCYEIHMKMDTNGSDGVGELWIDGVLRASNTKVNWSNNNSSAQKGWKSFDVKTNANNPSNGQVMYVDFDDFVVYYTTPPSRDAQGNPYIGPIGGTGGGGTTPPPPTTDTTAPVISNPQPASTLTFGTVSTIMRVTTNENATCKYGTSNVAYASLPSTFSTTGATSHSTSLTGLTNGSSATYYVRCIDSSGNASTASTPITVAVSTTQPSTSNIFFQDNFDNCTQGCTNASPYLAPAGWTSWYGAGNLATVGGVSHYAGEITSPGRGGGGKSLKTWRAGAYWEGYDGVLSYDFKAAYSEIYMRYYVKVPKELDLSRCSGSNYQKLWRLNTNGTAKEIYLNINQNGGSLYNTGNLQMYVPVPNSPWVTILNNTDLKAIWDGNWHSWEWHVNLNTGLVELWIDGVRRFSQSGTGFNFGGGTFTRMQHFSMGNHATGCSWQSSWQAMDIDDFVLSTSYVGPSGGTTPPPATDTTPPSVPSLTATAVSSSQINLSWTASTDNTGVTGYKIYRNGTYLTTTTSAYSYRVSAIDAAGNESSQSTAKSATTLAGTGGADTTPPAVPTGVTVS